MRNASEDDAEPPVLAEFSPFDLNKATTLTGGDLDALPFGVIVVDRSATILEYNTYERTLANMGTRQLIGLNFFRDVAPCTAVAAFEGRLPRFSIRTIRTSNRFSSCFRSKTDRSGSK